MAGGGCEKGPARWDERGQDAPRSEAITVTLGAFSLLIPVAGMAAVVPFLGVDRSDYVGLAY